MYLSVGEARMDGARLFIGIAHDVSERKRSAETAQRLAAIVESSDDAIVTKTMTGTIHSNFMGHPWGVVSGKWSVKAFY